MKKLVPLLVLMLSCFAAIPQSVRVLSATDLQPVSQCLIYDENKTISASSCRPSLCAAANGAADIFHHPGDEKDFSHRKSDDSIIIGIGH